MNEIETLINHLKKTERHRCVLILGGTGINFWQYSPFLKQLSLQELKEFKAVYCVSGSSGPYWFCGLSPYGQFREERVLEV